MHNNYQMELHKLIPYILHIDMSLKQQMENINEKIKSS